MNKDILIILLSDSKFNLLQIFDSNNKKIDEKKINNRYIFTGKLNTAYKIKIVSNNFCLNSSMYISEKYTGPYIFDLRKYHKIFVKLVDQNYNGLKIEKGEMKLWQSHIT